MAAATTEPTVLEKAPEVFSEEHVYQTWRVLARNPSFTGETARVAFANGEGILTALPASAKCPHGTLEACGVRTEGAYCRLHQRLVQLNALTGDPFTYRVKNRAGAMVTRKEPRYRVLTEAQYEAEVGARESEGDDLPDDF